MIPIKPRDVFWSDEQWLAIYASGQNILVNAGAGSGKTAVLTERIIRILKEGMSLDRLIVLTFTKAAATEMKERLRFRLTKEIEGGATFLKEALDFLDQAAVQTFDSFALSLVRRYHYLLKVDRSIRIGDSVLFRITKKKIIDEVFNEFYESEDLLFQEFISLFSLKNDRNVQNYLYNLLEKLSLLPNLNEYLENYLNKYYQEEFINQRIEEFISLLKVERERIAERLSWLKQRIDDEELMVHIYNCEEILSNLLEAVKYQDFLENINVRLPNIPRVVDDERQKAIVIYQKNEIKNSLKKLQDYLEYQSEEEMFKTIIETKTYTETLIKLIKRIESRIQAFKKENNTYEFLDIAKMAIQLVVENEDLKVELQEGIYEILIDEYQDTNDLQEILIENLSRNNVYMVGDIKQSIYRFRNANPEIFRKKYQEFKHSGQGLVIDLTKNFRSRVEVINNINLIFSQIMCEELGGVNYDESHKLQYGFKTYDNFVNNRNYNLEVINYDYDNQELNEHEIDAFLCAHDILEKIKNYQVYDKELKKNRPAIWSDFTILATEKKQFDLYKQIFEHLQIPLRIHKDENFVKSSEIYLLKNLLRSVLSYLDFEYYKNNFSDAIVGVLRSFLFDVDDKKISELFCGDLRQQLNLLFPEVDAQLAIISQQVQKLTLSQILWEIYQKFQVYEKIIRIGDLEQVEEKLNFLLDKFSEFDKLGFRLIDAIAYLEAIMAEDLDIEFSSQDTFESNAVNMMSIHKSKGLEFPFCYFPELGCRFNISDIKDKVVFDPDYGFILPVFSEGLKDTFYKKLLKQKFLKEEISERIRVLYVALTRAREQMVVISPAFSESYSESNMLVPFVDRLNYNSLFSVFSSISPSLENYSQRRILLNFNRDYKIIPGFKKLPISKSPKIEVQKYRLEKQKLTKGIASSSTQNLLDRKTIENLRFGTKIHKYLEILDYEDFVSQIDQIPEDIEIINKLKAFFSQEIFQKKIIKTYHEYQFIHEKEESISGSIDLILETEEELIIIDYKTASISNPEYKKQLLIYKEYLEDISRKKVSAYLYSLIKEEMMKVL